MLFLLGLLFLLGIERGVDMVWGEGLLLFIEEHLACVDADGVEDLEEVATPWGLPLGCTGSMKQALPQPLWRLAESKILSEFGRYACARLVHWVQLKLGHIAMWVSRYWRLASLG